MNTILQFPQKSAPVPAAEEVLAYYVPAPAQKGAKEEAVMTPAQEALDGLFGYYAA